MIWIQKGLAASILVGLAAPIHAQQGDLGDDSRGNQPEIWREMDVPPAPILAPEEALESFTLQDGFRLELAASEPLVNDPVAIAWDADGRLYALELWSYMPDPDGAGEDQPNGRVIVMEDLDGDGRMDRSTVYLDGLVMPRALAVVEGGLLVGDPPNLWFCEDLDGDLVSDRKRKVADYAVEGNVEHRENGLRGNVDNWLYNARSDRRMRWDGDSLRIEPTASRGQWGIDHDDYGRLFYTTNSNLLLADFYPFENANRNPGHRSAIGSNQTVASDQRVYANRINPGVNRAYQPNFLTPDNRLAKATAASGPAIYRGNKYPLSYYGNAFTPEPAANLVARFRIADEDVALRAEKIAYPDATWGQVDFLTSTDERFRPVNLYTGPDGFLYVVDMYRGILQHKTYLTTFLRKQIIERGLDEPVGLGRIYRLVHESSPPERALPKLSGYSELELADALADDNGWIRDTAQRLLAERDALASQTIQRLAAHVASDNELACIHALWTLHAHSALDEQFVLEALAHPSAWVRVHGLRTAEPLLAASAAGDPLRAAFETLFRDPAARVRLQALQSLAVLPDSRFIIDTAKAIFHPDIESPAFVDALVSSLHRHEIDFIGEVLAQPKWLRDPGRARLLEKLVAALYGKGQGEALVSLLSASAHAPNWKAEALFASLAAIVSEGDSAPLPLKRRPASLIAALARSQPERAAIVETAFAWPGKSAPPKAPQLTPEQQESVQRGQRLYATYCAACHQADGRGAPSLAPTLNGVDWVNGSPERLALIVSQGLHGPIEVKGETWNGVMPPHGALPDFQGQGLADVLSYLRSAWSNASGPVTKAQLQSTLEAHATRAAPWTAEELEAKFRD